MHTINIYSYCGLVDNECDIHSLILQVLLNFLLKHTNPSMTINLFHVTLVEMIAVII